MEHELTESDREKVEQALGLLEGAGWKIRQADSGISYPVSAPQVEIDVTAVLSYEERDELQDDE